MKTKPNPNVRNRLGQRVLQDRPGACAATLTLILLGFLLPAQGQDDPAVNPNYPTNVSVSLNAGAYFRLYGNTANPPLTYQWQHNEIDIPGATNWFLWVTNVSLADAGGCRARRSP